MGFDAKTGFLVQAYNPCSWYRLLEPARLFSGARIILAPNGFTDYVRAQAEECQAVVMGYVCQADEIEFIGWLKRKGISVIVDYDDNMFQICPEPNAENVVRACALADLLTVPTEFLAVLYARHAPNTPISVLPNRLDFSAWRMRSSANVKVTIVYAGSKFHTRDFIAVAADAIWAVLRLRQNAQFRVLGCEPLPIPFDVADRVQERPWRPVHEHMDAICGLDGDIAIAPLIRDWFNRGRSPLKWLQFAAQGIPMVLSDCEPYDQVVADGLTGFLAGSKAEWVDRLLCLVDFAKLRTQIGSAAYSKAHWKFNLADDAALRRQIYGPLLREKSTT